jgi:hypothetical protein
MSANAAQNRHESALAAHHHLKALLRPLPGNERSWLGKLTDMLAGTNPNYAVGQTYTSSRPLAYDGDFRRAGEVRRRR